MGLAATDYKKLKLRKRFKNKVKYSAHLKFLYDNCKWYPPPVIYEDEICVNRCDYVPNPKPYYKRCYRGNHKGNRYQWCKRYSNRIIRNYGDEIHRGAAYKRLYDYWWIVD